MAAMVPNQMRYQAALRSDTPGSPGDKGEVRFLVAEVKRRNHAFSANICEHRKPSTGIVPESCEVMFTPRSLAAGGRS